MKKNPFDHNKFIGYVSRVTPELTRIHFPNSQLLKKFYFDGNVLHSGIVRNYVIIEGEGYGFLGRIVKVELPEKERLFLSESSFQRKDSDFHPTAEVEIQLAFSIFGEIKAKKGLDQYPPVGSCVYACSPEYLELFLKDFGKDESGEVEDDLLDLATLPQDEDHTVKISANSLLGRHCAVVGTTGGGKSYTLAKLIEEVIKKDNSKIILLDATGEFKNLSTEHENVNINQNDGSFHYKNLQVQDLYSIFRPAGQVQVPKLNEAIRSLKIIDIAVAQGLNQLGTDGPRIDNGLLKKAKSQRKPFLNFFYTNSSKVNDNNINFDITRLPMQIIEECAWENDLDWGGVYDGHKGNCSSLVLRIQQRMGDDSYGSVFNFKNEKRSDLGDTIDKFIEEKNKSKLLRVDLSEVPKEKDLVEILANGIGRKLFNLAKEGKFKERPVICILDEAHIFLNKTIKDEFSLEVELDSFDRIAKECRKYGLFLCISTQRPRDIPQGVLSQMGSFIVHRLINTFDREAIASASPEGSRYLLSFLPSLGQGEALLLGNDFPMPVNLKIKKVSDKYKPNSNTPKLFRKNTIETSKKVTKTSKSKTI